MNFVKINNLTKNGTGAMDYKGLDIDSFVGGSQVYEKYMSYCILATNEEVAAKSISADITLLSETEYQNERAALEAGTQQAPTSEYIDRVAQLEKENQELRDRTAVMQDDQLAIMEILAANNLI